ncbi:DeoR/GlpR transcriptional regulator [Nakamurella flavida]|uniref:Lactose phosphotransferase system repressor n=1 Tax=Nakamurella flavida TaxID=363630 RepID=A0A939C3V6_9ACTN|nr:DeoR/GlpR family DNA-binding transcription regulator [Nakamurella flavida]MBM9478080.1 DeoR/GlpR transcriptional regulator [Nakamurella flavida]MDP9778699.1 DeoR/GlpR family transcriptional regulator of sugar metabolism [Nakamurella flavida]
MLLTERHHRIVESLRHGGLTVRDLATGLQVSESTIRRDLDQLDRAGTLTRTYGGAVLVAGADAATTDDGSAEDAFDDRIDMDGKRAIARAAVDLVEDDSVVILDIGTTTPLIARGLRGRPVTIITSNIAVLDEVRDDPVVNLVLLGGVLRRNYRSLVGSLTELALSRISADQMFLSCTGIRPTGHVVDNMAVEAPLKQSMIDAAGSVVLLAPVDKFPGTGALRLCSLTDIDVVITGSGAPATTLDLCREAGGKVILA